MSEDETPKNDTESRDADARNAESNREVDSDKEESRIEELEAQVKSLSVLVEVLMDGQKGEGDSDGAEESSDPNQLELTAGHHALDLVDGVKESVERFLGVGQGETLESRIGSTWLPRGAVILFMTVLVLGIRDESIAAVVKVSTAYSVSACFVVYGLWMMAKPSLFSKALLGTGLATSYLTTYGLFFMPETRLIEGTVWAVPSTIFALVLIAVLLYRAHSETTTGITFILIYYTVVLSLNQEIGELEVTYAFLTCVMVALMSMFLQFRHDKMVVSWISLAATYSTYIYFFVFDPPYLDFEGDNFQLLSIVFLTVVFLAYSIGCIGHIRGGEPGGKSVLYFGGVNFLTYLFLTWYPMRDYFPDYDAGYRGGISAFMVLLTVGTQRYGAKNSSIMQLFLVVATILMSLAFYVRFPIEWILIGFGLECLILSLVYRRFPLTVLKTLHAFLLVAIFAGSMSILNVGDTVAIRDWVVPVKWVSCVSTVVLLALIAWYYDNRIAPNPRTLYHQESHWFLANRRWNWSPNVMAVVNTTVGALILTALTIVDLANDPRLPFILAGEGFIFALIGIALFTPQMELSSVLMLVSAHVTFHFFWMTDKDGFETQPRFYGYVIGLTLVSYLASYFWERFLQRIEEGTPWEHDLLSSIPFVASTLIVTTFFERMDGTVMAPLGQVGLGLILMAVGSLRLLMGFRIAAIMALLIGCLNFYIHALDVFSPNVTHPLFIAVLTGFVLCLAFSERLLYRWEKKRDIQSVFSPVLHTGFIAVVIVYGGLGLWHWAEPERFSLYLMAFGVGLLVFGVVFRSARFRFGALLTIFGVFIRLYMYDLSNLAPVLKLVVFGVVTATLILISWWYSRRRIQRTGD